MLATRALLPAFSASRCLDHASEVLYRERVDNAEAAKKECKVVAEFRDKCVAIADDPKDGTTGFGWAIAA